MYLLVVENDPALGLFLQKRLKMDGHTVDWVDNGAAAIEHAVAYQPDLVLLDLDLPDLSGTDLLVQMREQLSRTSVLLLTSRDEAAERVRCLNLGADDILLKPFSFHELAARCRAVLRRKEHFADPTLRCGGLTLNRIGRSVQCDGVEVELTGKEFALLECMLQHSDKLRTRAELLREVWGISPDTVTNVVDVYVNYLRKKLAAVQTDGQSTAPVIETVRGQGYLLRSAGDRKPPVPVRELKRTALELMPLARTA